MRFSSSAYLIAALLAAGCSPSAMPTGYAHLNEYYKAAPGPEASNIGYPYTAVENAAAVQHWRAIASRLVDLLHSQLGLAPQPVYVQMLPDQNAFNASFDYALREELRSRGYTLVLGAKGVITLEPSAVLPKPWQETSRLNGYNGDDQSNIESAYIPKRDNFVIGIAAARDGRLVGEVKDKFNPPSYGYVKGAGSDRAQMREWESNVPEDQGAVKNSKASNPANILTPGPVSRTQDVEQEPLDGAH